MKVILDQYIIILSALVGKYMVFQVDICWITSVMKKNERNAFIGYDNNKAINYNCF